MAPVSCLMGLYCLDILFSSFLFAIRSVGARIIVTLSCGAPSSPHEPHDPADYPADSSPGAPYHVARTSHLNRGTGATNIIPGRRKD